MNMICEFFEVCFWQKCLTSGQRVEIRERIASEPCQKNRTKLYEVAGHVGRIETVVTNHLSKMFRSSVHKAAERNTAARINSDKSTETNS